MLVFLGDDDASPCVSSAILRKEPFLLDFVYAYHLSPSSYGPWLLDIACVTLVFLRISLRPMLETRGDFSRHVRGSRHD